MARVKTGLVYIKNEKARKSTLEKRKRGLFKKMHELSVLCGVDCCVIVYSPNCTEPEMWPSRLETEQVIQKYKDIPYFNRIKKMEEQNSLAHQELAKMKEQLSKIRNKNRLKQLSIVMNNNMRTNGGWIETLDLNYLTFMKNHVLKPKLEEMEMRIPMLNLEPMVAPRE